MLREKAIMLGCAVLMAGVLFVTSGCGTSSMDVQHRMARYRPEIGTGERSPWDHESESAAPEAGAESGSASAVVPQSRTAAVEGARVLKRGDRIVIYKRGIPNPDEIADEIDDLGNINLALIGTINIAGRSTAEAEQLIESAYIDGGYYNKINVVVVSQPDEYFMQGEVKQPGKYALSSDMTLLMAIASAGGYTDYANRREINIIRAEKVHKFDAVRIEGRKEEDPRVMQDDIIVVPRRVFL